MSDLPPPASIPPPASPDPTSAPATPSGRPVGKRRKVWLIVLLVIVTFGIWGIVWSYQTGADLKRYRQQGLGGVAYLLISIFIFPVTMFLMANEVEQAYIDDQRRPAITTIWGLWFLLPIIGPLIWYVRIQNAINDYWTAHGATEPPGV